MGLFNRHDDRPTPAQDRRSRGQSKQRTREELLESLKKNRIEAMTAQETAAYDANVCIARARRAIAENDAGEKAVAFNELRMHLVLYYYARAMVSNLRLMESNAQMQVITENFSNLVDRMNSMKLSSRDSNIQNVMKRAMKGIRPVDLVGVEDMMRQLVEGATSASSLSMVQDDVLENLVNGKVKLGDPIYAPEPQAAETPQSPAAVGQQSAEDEPESLEALLKLLEN